MVLVGVIVESIAMSDSRSENQRVVQTWAG